jgi:uncharacterized protein (TIGR03437 family)
VRLFLALHCCVLVALAADASLPQQTVPTACKAGGFVVLDGVTGRADPSFNVLFDPVYYQNNGFDVALRSAMDQWSKVSGSNWRYNFAGYGEASDIDGRVSVAFNRMQLPPDVLAVSMVRYQVSTGNIVDADIFFSNALPINTNPSKDEWDFIEIALHEMGHSLGLGHNDDCATSVMHSTVTAGEKSEALNPPEIAGVKYLYSGTGVGVSLAPFVMLFSAEEAAASPGSQTIAITGPAGARWTASPATVDGLPWLSVSPASGTVPGTLTVRVANDGLASGFHDGFITIDSGGVSQGAVVTFNVLVPGLRLDLTSLRFASALGGPAPERQLLQIEGPGNRTWTASSTADWLRPANSTGTLPATLSVSAVPAGLARGTYTATLRITSSGFTRDLPASLTLLGPGESSLFVNTTQLSLTSQTGFPAVVCRSVALTSFGNGAIDWSARTGAPWLSMLPASGRAPGNPAICASAETLAPGTYNSVVTINSNAPNGPQSVTVSFTATPRAVVSSTVNAATFASNQPVAPNQIVTIFGSNLATSTAQASRFPLPTELGGARVLLDGVPAPLLFASSGQINLVAPAELAGVAGSNTLLNLYSGSLAARAISVPVSRQSPGVFSALGNGVGAGSITHRDGSLVSRNAPLQTGEAVSVYLTGLGGLNPPVANGAPAPSNPLSRSTARVRLLFDGQEGQVLFAGASPGFAGLQVVVGNAPASLRRRFPEVTVEVDGAGSNVTTAGGPSLLDVSPATVRPGADATVTLRGRNFPPGAVARVGSESLAGVLTEGDLQSLRVTVPARLLSTSGRLALTVADPASPQEPVSNPVNLNIAP